MREGIALIGAVLLGGCVTSNAWLKDGLTEQKLLELEAEDWGNGMGQLSWSDRAKDMGVPINARAIVLREIKCQPDDGKPRLYECSYLMDWGRGSQVEGAYRRRFVTVGRDEHGEWSNGWVVVD